MAVTSRFNVLSAAAKMTPSQIDGASCTPAAANSGVWTITVPGLPLSWNSRAAAALEERNQPSNLTFFPEAGEKLALRRKLLNSIVVKIRDKHVAFIVDCDAGDRHEPAVEPAEDVQRKWPTPFTKEVSVAGENLRVQTERYRSGATTIIDLITAQVGLAEAEAGLVQARFAIRLALAGVEAILGRRLF